MEIKINEESKYISPSENAKRIRKEVKEYFQRQAKGQVTLKDYHFSEWFLYHLENNKKLQFISKIIFQIIIPIMVTVPTTLIVMKKIAPLIMR